ncbi:MAG: hypothetical protein ACK5MI_05115 [Mangrovibacterium sp.]
MRNCERITVSFEKQTLPVKADAAGRWFVKLAPMEANANGQMLKIKGKSEELVYNNVLVGEVWLCSGQSNMEYWMTPRYVEPRRGENLATEELKKPDNNMIITRWRN